MASVWPRTPYHMGDQTAKALLGPPTAEVAEIEARLAQYFERLHMSDRDRETIGRARSVLASTLAQLRHLGS